MLGNLWSALGTFSPHMHWPTTQLECAHRGILVPGGFGNRGTEGMMLAIKWAREQQVPFLGICLGFQLAVVEWARHVCGFKGTLDSPPLPYTRSHLPHFHIL